MAVEKGINPFSFPASADLSARQYRFVNLASDGEVQAASAGAWILGVLQNKPAAVGRGAAVQTQVGTVTKLFASSTATGAISVGSALRSAANGVAIISSTGGTAFVGARALEAVSTGTNEIISALITLEGPTSTA